MSYKENIRIHKFNVMRNMDKIVDLLIEVSRLHDDSKLKEPEYSIMKKNIESLRKLTYGSKEYKLKLKEMDKALTHHYKNNDHHPEHFENGINDMNLVQVVEMFCDWFAATLKHDDGDIMESIRINKDRFNMSDQLVNIFINTVDLLK